MAFITNSVGLGGRNSPPDVTIIQWMLIRAQNNYGTNLFDAGYKLSESGTVDNQTGLAIKAIISYPRRSISSPLLLAPVLQPQNSFSFSFLSSSVISPDDENYKFLLKCTPKPICTIPLTNIKIDFNDDPLVVQALAGTLNFQAFKSAVEAKDSGICGESNDSNYCGVNPITREPGIIVDEVVNRLRPGGLGRIRPGDRGAGGFRERTGGKHDGLDISAPLGTPVYANRAGTITTSSWSGKTLLIKHSGGISTLYAHLSKYEVTEGQVDQGQLIGYSGESGNAAGLPVAERHVHFGVFSGEGIPETKGARWMNPAVYLNSPCPVK